MAPLRRVASALPVLLALLMTACNGGTPDTTPATTTTPPPTTEPPVGESFEIFDSQVRAVLDDGYVVGSDGRSREPEPGEAPVEPGDVTATWYLSTEVWVVLFEGLSVSEAGPLCPGASILTESGFANASNAEVGEGACEGFDTTGGPGEARVCGDVLMYVSEVPVDAEGTLFASIERREENGNLTGVTSMTAADVDDAPPIDLDAGLYTMPTSLGGGQVTCVAG